ncbi:importin-9 isoform X4 [Camellia sinensis]|nr:importin-9 isoform X4 [Camellia sinensis]
MCTYHGTTKIASVIVLIVIKLTLIVDTMSMIYMPLLEHFACLMFQGVACFGSALAKVAANRELPLGLRQLAAVLLKQFIKKHWQEDEETFEHPVVSSEEKAAIRRILLLLLDDSQRKICTAVSMAVASIAHYDWPEDWPDLMPLLLKLISDQTNINGVHGALRCLALLSGDLDDTVVPTLVPVLFPCLHTIVSSPQIYDKTLRAKALSIVYSCTAMLGAMSGVYKTETSALISPMVATWMDQFSIIMEPPVQSEDPDDWSIRMEVLKCLNQFVQNFPSLTEMQFMVVMGPLWQTFVSSLRVYERSAIEGTEDSYEGRYDSDGAEQSLESFVIQLFEFLLIIVGSAKLVKVVANNIKELAYYTIAFLQMTEQQVHTWSLDANQYVADEDDNTYSCRISGALLLEEVINSCGIEAIDAIIDAAKNRFAESQQAKVAGSAAWWRMREATLYGLASLSDQLLEAEVSEHTRTNLGNLFEQIIAEDAGTVGCIAYCAGVHEYPFLFARVFSSVAKFSSVISRGVVEHILYAAIKAIGMDVPPPVKVGACRALSQLLPDANKGMLQPHIMGLFSSLADLLNQASDETMHLVLETLQAAIKADDEAPTSIEPVISPIILNLWASHVSDPFISIDAVEVLEAIKNAPGCIQPLVSRILPYIGPILNKPQRQPDGLVAGALDLLTMLLKNSPSDVVKAVYETCFDSVIRIVLQTDDHSEMQNATECLASLLSVGKKEVLAWGGNPGFTMKSLLDVASRLLDPDLESSGSLFVGSYILQLILHLPSQMAPHIRVLVAALVRRMQSSKIAGLRSSLILIFARLVHMSAPHVEQYIDLLISVPAEGHSNSFVYVMSEWTKQQGEIQGSYEIKVTTTALALLLSTRHIELWKINVQGHLIKSTTGITTRSKAKLAPDQWSSMLLPAKILALLADVLIEIQEQVLGGDDEDSEWEEVQGDLEADQDLLHSAAATSYTRPSYEYLDAMAKALNEDKDDGDEDELLSDADPLNEINLANYLFDFFVKFSQSDKPLFDHLCQSLTKPQQNAVLMVLNR